MPIEAQALALQNRVNKTHRHFSRIPHQLPVSFSQLIHNVPARAKYQRRGGKKNRPAIYARDKKLGDLPFARFLPFFSGLRIHAQLRDKERARENQPLTNDSVESLF